MPWRLRTKNSPAIGTGSPFGLDRAGFSMPLEALHARFWVKAGRAKPHRRKTGGGGAGQPGTALTL
eukprot:scaffold47792_cov69-Phaeocystis_antarctica.AAC.7